jgi:hypothetical protein
MYQLRRCRSYTISEASEVVELNPEDFRDISYPFLGVSEEDFLNYLDEMQHETDIYDIYDELDEGVADSLAGLLEPEEYEEYYNSATKGEDSWLESGEVNEEYRKYGGFNARERTLSEEY